MPMNRKNYPKNWEEISAKVRERAGDHCETCGVENGKLIQRWKTNPARYRYLLDLPADLQEEALKMRRGTNARGWWNPIKVILTVAHLDHDETNPHPDPKRLRALCQRCHLTYDREDNLRRRQMREMREKAEEVGQELLDLDAPE